jgi:uncharacterized membrane protein
MHATGPGPLRSPEDGSADPGLAPEAASAGEDASSLADLRDDLTALVDDARNYAEAEIAFQKTRAGLAGKLAGRTLVLLVLALVLLNIALIVLAVCAVFALAPLVTIWGAIAIVVGALLIGVAALVLSAMDDGKMLAAMFGSGEDA